MKTILTLLNLVLILNLNFGQTGFTKKSEAKNETLNGKKHGKWIEYRDSLWKPTTADSAKYYHLVIYDNGVKTETGRDYYLNGQLQNAYIYMKGVKNGPSTWYYETGELSSETVFKDDKRHGLSKWYYKSGRLREMCD